MAKPASGTALNGSDPLVTSLVACWAFLENSGTTSADSTGNGHTLTGVGSNGTSWGTSGSDVAMAFAGTGIIPLPVTSPITLPTNTAWSIAWRGHQTTSGAKGMIAGSSGDNINYLWMNGGNYLKFSSSNTTPSSVNFTGVTSFTADADYLLTLDQATGKFHIYKDGAEIGTGTAWPNSASSGIVLDTVGNGYTTNAQSLTGTITYLYVWNGRTLTSTDASTLHANPYGMFAAAAASFTIAPTAIPANHAGNITLTLTGTSTAWDGTTVFSLSGVAGVTKVSQSVASATSATVVVTTGATTGTLTVTESVTGTATATTTVGTASFAISPSSGNTGVTQSVSATGTNTVWTQETAATLFSLTGGTGASLSSIVVTDDTHASFSLVNGSAVGSLTITDAPSGDTATFTVTSPSGTITVTNPVPWQTYQRDGSNAASFTVAGTYTGTAPTSIQASLAGGTAVTLTSATISGGSFTGTATMTVTPGTSNVQGTLTVDSLDAGSAVIASTTVANIGIGDVFVSAGQSNADGRLYLAQSYTHATLKATCFELGGTWKEGNDLTSTTTANGSLWPLIATQHMADQGVPFCIITTAVGSTALVGGGWAAPSSGATSGGSDYSAMKTRVNTTAKTNAVKGVLWYQGEQDVLNGVTQIAYLDAFRAFANAAASDLIGSPKTLPFQIGYTGSAVDHVRLALADAVTLGGNVAAGMPAIYDQSNATHPGNTSGDQALGAVEAKRFWAAIKAGFFAGTDPGRGPRVVAINHDTARTTIAVAFDQILKTGLTFTASAWTVTGNGSAATVSSVAYSATDPNAVLLTLSAAAATPILVSFGLGSSTAGKVVPLGPNIAMPDGSGNINLPAEPFSAVQSAASETTGGGMGGSIGSRIFTGM